MKRWNKCQFNDLVDFPPKVALSRGDEYPFIEMEDVDPSRRYVSTQTIRRYENSSCSKFEDKDILLARITPCLENGKIAQVRLSDNKKGFGSTEFFVFRARKGVANQSFLFYLTKCDLIWKNAVNSMVGASGRQRADANFLKRVEIEVPSLPIQEKIAAILSAYDDLIENNNRRIEILEKMSEELYREWFVRLRFSEHKKVEIIKGVPERWEIRELNEISEITSSKRIYADEYVSAGIPFFRSKEIIEKSVHKSVSTELFISEDRYNDINHKYGSPQKGDILITSVGTLGIVYMVKESDKFYFKDGNLIWFRKIKDELQNYLYCWLISEGGKGALLETTIGTSQPAFTIENLKKIKLLIPSSEQLTKFNRIITPINKSIENMSSSLNYITMCRDRLLSRLMSGKIDVENMDIEFPSSMKEELVHA